MWGAETPYQNYPEPIMKILFVSRETENNSNLENALRSIKLECAAMAAESGQTIQLRSQGGWIIDTFEPA